MSGSPPYMPLYVADYLADTGHLSTIEHGAYLLLLMHYWRTGALPIDDDGLARIARMSMRRWAFAKQSIIKFFSEDHVGKIPALRIIGEYARSRSRISDDVREEVFRRDGSLCVYCGTVDGPFHLDHSVPWSKGGLDTVENLVVACAPCNFSKGAKFLKDWLQ